MGNEANLRFKLLIGIFALLSLAAFAYVASNRHPVNRFKPMDEEGYVAFDSVSGQLCKTFPLKELPKKLPVATSSNHPRSPENGKPKDGKPIDAILDSIKSNAPIDSKVAQSAQIEFIRGLPACVDIQ
jgi:hypothetical protein